MLDKSKLLECFEGKYSCLEDECTDDCSMFTFGNEEEPLALNIQLFDDSIIVSVIDKDNSSVIDRYDDTVESDEDAVVKVGESLTNFENIKEVKMPEIIKAKEAVKESEETGVDDFKEQRDEGVYSLSEIEYACHSYIENFSRNEFWYKDENMDELKKTMKEIYIQLRQGAERAFGITNLDKLFEVTESKEVNESCKCEKSVVESLLEAADKLECDSSKFEEETASRIVSSIGNQIKSVCEELKSVYPQDC